MRTDISRILHAARTTPWAILPAKLSEIRAVLLARAGGADVQASQDSIKAAENRQSRYVVDGAIAVINVFGTIAQRMNWVMAESGGTSTEILQKTVTTAAADEGVSAVLLNFDTPGGTVSGLPEAHAAIMEARAKKPVVGSINSMSASAGYWLTSACSEVVITPSGEAGSVGVFSMHVDESEYDKAIGVKISLIHAGKHKVEGNPFEPLSEEARAAIQADVDAYYAMFVRDVAKGRGVSVSDVKKNYGEGRMLMAPDAKAAGMVDRIESFPDTLARLSGSRRRGGKSQASILDMNAMRNF